MMAGPNLEKIPFIFLLLTLSGNISGEVVYDFVQLYEYSDFSSTWPFTFRVPEGVSHASWHFQATSSHPASCEKKNVTVYLQYGSLPVINPLGEKFPSNFYITSPQLKRLHVITDNLTLSTSLRNPQPGHWYGVAYLPKTENHKILPADLFMDCKYKFRSWFTTEASSDIKIVSPDEKVDVSLPAEESSLFKFYIPLNTVNHTVAISNCAVTKDNITSCPLLMLSKGQGIPGKMNSSNFVNCTMSASADICELLDVNPVVNDWTYLLLKSETQEEMTLKLEVKVTEMPVQPKPVTKQESESQSGYQLLPILDRFSYNSMYKNKFAYSVGGTVKDVVTTLTADQCTVLPFKLEPDGDTGGSLVILVQLDEIVATSTLDEQVAVEFCILKNKLPYVRSTKCESGFLGNTTSNGQRSNKVILPYPSPATYFVGLKMKCFTSSEEKNQSITNEVPCGNTMSKVKVNITTNACVEGKCSSNGRCHNYLNGQILFSTCRCYAGWRGYDCSDGEESRDESEQLLELLLLTLSNLLFIPAIILALYRRHFVEAFVYTYTMTFSGLYHACDGNRTDQFKFCPLHIQYLSIADFLGSSLCIWVTLVAMARPPKKLKAVLQMAGPLGLLFGVLYKKTSAFLFIAPAGLGLLMIFISWVCRCCYRHKCYPTIRKYLLCLLPGVLLAVGGICIFAFVENRDNYLYVHSGWHGCMSLCIVFLLPPRERKGAYKVRQTNSINLGSTYQPIRPAEDNYVI